MARRKQDHGTEPMFEAPVAPVASKDGAKQKRPRAVARGRCPQCSGSGIDRRYFGRVGLAVFGSHLLWARHDVITYAGARVECQASGRQLCELPALDDDGKPMCPCGH